MSDAKKKGLTIVEADVEQMEEQIHAHRKRIARAVLITIAVLLLLFVVAELYLALRSFSSYTITSTTDRSDSQAVSFVAFNNNILKYSNDGATYMDGENAQIWNQSYEMASPVVTTCKNYAAIYDRGGIDVYLMTTEKTLTHMEMKSAITSVALASQGSIAVLMKEGTTSYVKLYDKSGDELASGEFYQKNGGFPVDIALSYDAKLMALSMVDVSDGNLKSTITFYNFGSVGQNEIDNNVGVYAYSDMLIPEIEYVSNSRMVALGDNEIIVFEGSEKPKVGAEISLEEDPVSIVYNERYFAVTYQNAGEDISYQLKLYDAKGRERSDLPVDFAYSDIYFLEDGEVCLQDDTQCCIYTTNGIRKFEYTFDQNLKQILSKGKGANYIFIMEDATQEVRLR